MGPVKGQVEHRTAVEALPAQGAALPVEGEALVGSGRLALLARRPCIWKEHSIEYKGGNTHERKRIEGRLAWERHLGISHAHIIEAW